MTVKLFSRLVYSADVEVVEVVGYSIIEIIEKNK